MATVRAQKWAYFLKRLGFQDSKTSIMNFVDHASDNDVWERYISSNPYALEACKESKITNVVDIWWLFEQISYAGMRSTFPPNSNGRRPIGPRIVPMKGKQNSLKSNKQSNLIIATLAEKKSEVQRDDSPLSNDFIGRRVIHTTFGEGVLISIQKRNLIIIKFDQCGEKLLSYKYCIEKGYLVFI